MLIQVQAQSSLEAITDLRSSKVIGTRTPLQGNDLILSPEIAGRELHKRRFQESPSDTLTATDKCSLHQQVLFGLDSRQRKGSRGKKRSTYLSCCWLLPDIVAA